MIVMTNNIIAKCSEISLADTVIYGFVEVDRIADAIKKHGDETVIDFRR